ncbi:hypothetical protein EVAR_68408_1 [Eumeta japonica]|uniref:Uncharacterized protein n=1 Tax=Eumeta variegata TaxID=151549 RepID=A0A4C2A1U2_EUMVA|nr:hypothetical protein EVAR_68408_1 [Eumeta japonica]
MQQNVNQKTLNYFIKQYVASYKREPEEVGINHPSAPLSSDASLLTLPPCPRNPRETPRRAPYVPKVDRRFLLRCLRKPAHATSPRNTSGGEIRILNATELYPPITLHVPVEITVISTRSTFQALVAPAKKITTVRLVPRATCALVVSWTHHFYSCVDNRLSGMLFRVPYVATPKLRLSVLYFRYLNLYRR